MATTGNGSRKRKHESEAVCGEILINQLQCACESLGELVKTDSDSVDWSGA